MTVQRPVTPQRAGASGSKINDDSVSTFKQACSGRYSGSLKLSSRRFERAHNRSAPLLTLFSIAPEVNGLGRYRAVIRVKFGVKTAYFQQQTARARVPFLPGIHLTTRLRGEAFAFYRSCSKQQKADYDILVKACGVLIFVIFMVDLAVMKFSHP